MTNQEAADELKYAIDLIKQDGKDWLDERDIPVLEMAISALQAQPNLQPTCNQLATDTISRQAALALAKDISVPTKDGTVYRHRCIDPQQIRGLPSAQPEIIRCKDCENWIPGYITDNDDFIPPKCGKYQQMVGHSSDDYCSKAERRTDDGE